MSANHRRSFSSSLRNKLGLYYRALIHIVALMVALHLVLHIIVGEKWLPVAFLDTFAHLIWMFSTFLLVLNLLFRKWSLAAFLLPAALTFLLTWGGLFLPKNIDAAPSTYIPIRIMTFNLKGDNQQQEAIVQLIRAVDADIVALQEVSNLNTPLVEANLQDLYPYMTLHPMDSVTQGQGILSRYPIIEDEFWQYDFVPAVLGHQRSVIALENNTMLAIYNLHPSHPAMNGALFDPHYRSLEIDAILQRSTHENIPNLLLGDFNMPDLSDDYAAITHYYKDAHRSTGFGMGFTFPNVARLPLFMRLDYIFYSDTISAQTTQVWPSGAGSDHRPLIAELFIAPAE